MPILRCHKKIHYFFVGVTESDCYPFGITPSKMRQKLDRPKSERLRLSPWNNEEWKKERLTQTFLFRNLVLTWLVLLFYVLVVGIDRKIAGDCDYASDEFHKVTWSEIV